STACRGFASKLGKRRTLQDLGPQCWICNPPNNGCNLHRLDENFARDSKLNQLKTSTACFLIVKLVCSDSSVDCVIFARWPLVKAWLDVDQCFGVADLNGTAKDRVDISGNSIIAQVLESKQPARQASRKVTRTL